MLETGPTSPSETIKLIEKTTCNLRDSGLPSRTGGSFNNLLDWGGKYNPSKLEGEVGGVGGLIPYSILSRIDKTDLEHVSARVVFHCFDLQASSS